MSYDKAIRKCLQVLSTCYAVAVIETPYQSQSTESQLELSIAKVLSMQVKTVDEWIEHTERQKQHCGLCRRGEMQ